MKTETIKAIFTNLIFVIGIGLLIFGFIRGGLTVSRLIIFDKYPLNTYEETRCQNQPFATVPMKDGSVVQQSPAEIAEQLRTCQQSLDHDRKVRKTEDIVTALTTLVAGTVLVMFFRRFIFA